MLNMSKIHQHQDLSHICPECMKNKGAQSICKYCGYDEERYKENPLYIPPKTILRRQYLIGNVIGQGGFGITYVGLDINLNKKVAIKEYLPTSLAARALRETQQVSKHSVIPWKTVQESAFHRGLDSFLEEARKLAEFQHENIVSVLNYFEENKTGYIVMEYLEGQDFSSFLRANGGSISPESALKILFPILDALKEIHSKELYHKDISATNIRITKNNKPVLIDFGAAKYIASEVSHSLDKVYKPGYSPIEQMTGTKRIGPWTDIYACGALFYLMVTGTLPASALARFEKDELKPLLEFDFFLISKQISDTIAQALSVKIEDRFQSVEEFEEALKKQSPKVNTLANTAPKKSYKKPILITVIFLLLFGLGSLIYYYFIGWYTFSVTGIKQEHQEGDIINYSIEWDSHRVVKTLFFNVENTSIKEAWDVGKPTGSQEGFFSTENWQTDDYTYTLVLIDDSGRPHRYQNHFKLVNIDNIQPRGSVNGIQASYRVGDQINYTIEAYDNKQLKAINFKVGGGLVDQLWQPDGPHELKQTYFSTMDWEANQYYTYVLQIKDQSNNQYEETGSFYLAAIGSDMPATEEDTFESPVENEESPQPEEDTELPVASLIGLQTSYQVGEQINVTMQVSDNEQLKTLQFSVEDTEVNQLWEATDAQLEKQMTFSTQNWKPKTYQYVLIAVDQSDNFLEKVGSFTLKPKPTPLPPIVRQLDKVQPVGIVSGFRESYTVGQTITYTVEAYDNVALKTMTFEILGTEVKKEWQVSGLSSNQKDSFSTDDWPVRTYVYSLIVEDRENNTSEQYVGEFNLTKNESSQSQPPSPPKSSDTPQQQLASLLATCQQHYNAQRYTIGEGGTALACYQQVLQLDSQNTQAKAQLKAMQQHYQEWVEKAIARGQYYKAQRYLAGLEKVNPNASVLSRLKQKLKNAEQASHQVVVKPNKPSNPPPHVPQPIKREQPTYTPKPVVVSSCRGCDCAEIRRQFSLGVDPLTSEQQHFFQTQCR